MLSPATSGGHAAWVDRLQLRRWQFQNREYGYGAGDHNSAGKSDGADGTGCDVYGCGDGHGAVELSVAKEWRGGCGRYFGKLHDAYDNQR